MIIFAGLAFLGLAAPSLLRAESQDLGQKLERLEKAVEEVRANQNALLQRLGAMESAIRHAATGPVFPRPGSLKDPVTPYPAGQSPEVGKIVAVKYGTSWWAGRIVEVRPNQRFQITYLGWEPSWDEEVGLDRLGESPEAARVDEQVKKGLPVVRRRAVPEPPPSVPIAAGTRSWGPEQATGQPNTSQHADLPTAWASQDPDRGEEWLELVYEEPMPIQKIRVFCTFNPGALVKVTAFLAGGQEVIFWEGSQPSKDEIDVFEVVAKGEPPISQKIKLYFDTKRKSGWNEIDAVELIGGGGKSQWAKEAKASSFYGEAGGSAAKPASPRIRRRTQPLAQTEPAVGQEAPGFEIKTTDDKTIRLADFRGKYVLLDFWATWCGPCVAETPNLKAVYDAYGARENFVMIGLSLDSEKEKPMAYAKEKGTQWIDGFLGDWGKDEVTKKYGVGGIPSIWLIGPDGKVVAKGLRGEAILQAVKNGLEGKAP